MTQAQLRPAQSNRPKLAPMPAGQIRALGMNAKVWQRHASPLSVYSRMATLPVLILAIWSHAWFGTGFSVAATVGIMIWLWLNPRLFPPPRNTNNWASKAVFGERIWLNRLSVPIPPEDANRAMLLSLVSGVGFLAALSGAFLTNPVLAISGIVVTYAGKLSFLNNMASLYDRMRDSHPLYRFWSVSAENDNRETP